MYRLWSFKNEIIFFFFLCLIPCQVGSAFKNEIIMKLYKAKQINIMFFNKINHFNFSMFIFKDKKYHDFLYYEKLEILESKKLLKFLLELKEKT